MTSKSSNGPKVYRFEVSGRKAEPLGEVAFPGDIEAVDFATGVIQGLLTRDPRRYVGCTIDILEKERVVATIPF